MRTVVIHAVISSLDDRISEIYPGTRRSYCTCAPVITIFVPAWRAAKHRGEGLCRVRLQVDQYEDLSQVNSRAERQRSFIPDPQGRS